MSAMIDNAMPSGLQKVIGKVSNYRVNHTRLLPESSDSVSPNGQLRVKLPTNTIINCASLLMHCKNTITGTALTYSPSLEQYISRVDLRAGGESIMSINNYNDLFTLLSNASMSDNHQRTRHVMNVGGSSLRSIGPRPTYVIVDQDYDADDENIETAAETSISNIIAGNLTEGAPNTITDADKGTLVFRDRYYDVRGTNFCVASTWLGLHDLGHVDTSLFPQMELELTFSGNNILAETTPDGAWALSNVYFTIETLQFPQYSNALYQAVMPNPDTGMQGEVYYKFKRYVNLQFDKSSASSYDHKFSVASSSIDKIWFTMKNNAYATQAALTPGNPPNYFVFSDTATNQIEELQLFVDEKVYPSYRIHNLQFGLAEYLRQLGVHNDNQFDCRINSDEEYRRCKWFACWNFENLSNPDNISGLNTLGLSSGLRIHVDCDGALATGGAFYAFVETSAVLAVSAGRVIRVEL